jgi:hypothetical protein
MTDLARLLGHPHNHRPPSPQTPRLAGAGTAEPTGAGTAGPGDGGPGGGGPAGAGTAGPAPVGLRRRQRWSASWRSGFGVLRDELDEIDELGNHILERLHDNPPRNLSEVSLRDWVTSRFMSLLLGLLVKASSNTRGYLLLNLIVIGGGFATSGIAVAAGTGHQSSTAAWVVFGVGLAVALAGGISQAFRPGHRATQRNTLGMELKDEGWAFVLKTRKYPGVNPAVDFDHLNQRVSDIYRRAALIMGLAPEPGTEQRADDGNQPSNKAVETTAAPSNQMRSRRLRQRQTPAHPRR